MKAEHLKEGSVVGFYKQGKVVGDSYVIIEHPETKELLGASGGYYTPLAELFNSGLTFENFNKSDLLVAKAKSNLFVQGRLNYKGIVKSPKEYYKDWTVDELIEEFGLGFRLGNAVKYILRVGKKTDNKANDLKKAVTYIERELERVGRWTNNGKETEYGNLRWGAVCNTFALSPLLSQAMGILLGLDPSGLEHLIKLINWEIESL